MGSIDHKAIYVINLIMAISSCPTFSRCTVSLCLQLQLCCRSFLCSDVCGIFKLSEMVRVGDSKKVYAIEVLPQVQLVAIICGRNKNVRLHSWGALDGSVIEDSGIKIEDTRTCTALCSGTVRQGTTTCLCVAMKK